MKNITKKTKVKFGFMLFIGLLVVIVFVSQLKDGSDDKEVVKEPESEELKIDEIDQEQLKEIEKNYKDSDKQVDEEEVDDADDKNEEVTDEEDDVGYETIDDEFDFESQIIEKVGEKQYKELLKKSDQASKLLTSNEKEGWEEVATESLVKDIKSGETELLKANKVDSIDVYPTEQFDSDDVFMGLIVAHDETTKSYSFIYKKVEDDYLIDNIVLMWGD